MPGRFYAVWPRIAMYLAKKCPRLGPIFLSKIDISDGFSRISIRSDDVPKLAIMFPTEAGEEQLIGLPLALPIGWKQPHPFSQPQRKQLLVWPTASYARNRLFRHTAWTQYHKFPPSLK
jgi:hypothetical protein